MARVGGLTAALATSFPVRGGPSGRSRTASKGLVIGSTASLLLHGAALSWAVVALHAAGQPGNRAATASTRPTIVWLSPAPVLPGAVAPERVAAAPDRSPPMHRPPAQAPAPRADTAAAAESHPPTPASHADGTAPDIEYFPRSMLSIAPRAAAGVSVLFPDGVDGVVHLVARVELFIDEQGIVQRVVALDALPPIFEDAVRSTFSRTRFTPGKIDGMAVRSRIRIEVSFDSDRVDTNSASPIRPVGMDAPSRAPRSS
jgi:periplasmic protein TonB